MEILIVIALVAILALALIVLINPWEQLGKANDAKRKHDLNVLQKTFEDYYNDKGCYPQAEHVCYDPAELPPVCETSKKVSSRLCNICGKEAKPPKFDAEFASYIPELPCDPEHPRKDYLYHVDKPGCERNNAAACAELNCPADYCPQWYRVYAQFSSKNDADSEISGCKGGGCGPAKVTPPYGYDYGVSSHQVGLERSSGYTCIQANNCNGCQAPGNYQGCIADDGCTDKTRIYATVDLCCQSSPKPANCP